jgi:putative phosphoesterase
MRIAVMSDIHGNVAALEAVLGDIRRHGVDLTVNVGDSLSGPLYPRETADTLLALDLPTVRGNHDRQLVMLPPEEMGPSDLYAHACLNDTHRRWLAAQPVTLRLASDVFVCHGTPASDSDYFLEQVGPSGARCASPVEIEVRAGTCDAALILCGHTHLARSVRLPDGRLVLNPGSVGLPAYADDKPYPHVMEAGTPHARYAIACRRGDGAWTAQFKRVRYDWTQTARIAARRGRCDWAVALRTGHARVTSGVR